MRLSAAVALLALATAPAAPAHDRKPSPTPSPSAGEAGEAAAAASPAPPEITAPASDPAPADDAAPPDSAPPAAAPAAQPDSAPPAAAPTAHKPRAAAPIATPRPTGSIRGHVTLVDKEGPHPAAAAIVFVEKADPALWKDATKVIRPKGAAAEVSMSAKQFAPRVVPVLVGEEVRFPNLDPIFHNVFSLTAKNKFDLGLYKDGASKTKAFSEPGVVRLFCNIHPKMTAYLLVLQNPWVAVPGSDGRFEIARVAPGSYTLKAWDEKGGELVKDVEVKAGAAATVDFVLDGSGYRELPHKNKFGQDYGEGY